MSRCFPYLPPGYLAKRDNSDALIESIKLQRASSEKANAEEKAKAERKAERKKEKKREKKEKKHHDKKRKRTDEKEHKSEKERAYLSGKTLQNGGDEEQRSGVTEEHEPPASLQRPCYSSDSTENSNKRSRPTMPEYGISTHGTTIKIRLSSLKRKESDPVVAKERSLTTLNTDSALKRDTTSLVQRRPLISVRKPLTTVNAESAPSTAPLIVKQPLASFSANNSRPDKEQGCSTSGVSRDCPPLSRDTSRIASSVPRVSKEVKTVTSLYNELFENWVAPSLQNDQMDVDDQDWLFQRKLQKNVRSKVESSAVATDVCSRSSMLWPRAQFLPDVDVYALPFTVPL